MDTDSEIKKGLWIQKSDQYNSKAIQRSLRNEVVRESKMKAEYGWKYLNYSIISLVHMIKIHLIYVQIANVVRMRCWESLK